jgi:hypothetical protein
MWKRFDLDADQGAGVPGRREAFRDNEREGLADVVDRIRGQQGLVLNDIADLVLSRNIPRCENGRHIGRSGSSRRIQLPDFSMGNG